MTMQRHLLRYQSLLRELRWMSLIGARFRFVNVLLVEDCPDYLWFEDAEMWISRLYKVCQHVGDAMVSNDICLDYPF